MVSGFFIDDESQPLVERTGRSIGFEDGKDDTAPAGARIVKELTGNLCPDAIPLMLGRNAERVEFDLLAPFKRHKEADPNAATLDNLCSVQLELFLKLLDLFACIPKSTGSRNVNTHGT